MQQPSATPSSHSTISNTPATSAVSTANPTPRLKNTTTTTTTAKSTSTEPPQNKTLPPPNVTGKLTNTTASSPPPRLLQIPIVPLPTLDTETASSSSAQPQPSDQHHVEYIALPVSNTTDASSKPYPLLHPASPHLLDATTGRLKPSQEREKMFEDLEMRVVMLRAKCAEVARATKSLQKACVASSATMQFGGGIRKKTSGAAGGGGLLGQAIGLDGEKVGKERLREEVVRLVRESRALRESFEEANLRSGEGDVGGRGGENGNGGEAEGADSMAMD
ncbi:hypothetical protein HDU98_011159 [Podochytrium sp. JEL0797]|nr:hypothetical protein HDU98_011159 [Podochytrium sp. JEL0797]